MLINLPAVYGGEPSPQGRRSGHRYHGETFCLQPDKVTLKKGQTVRLRLHSEDVTHGFFLRPLKLDEEIPAGQTTEVTITPQTAGTFTTICDHFCGSNHGNMSMTIVVE